MGSGEESALDKESLILIQSRDQTSSVGWQQL